MVDMQDREKAFENKFAHDEEFQFKVMARRNKLLGLWAADQMAKPEDAAAAYAKEVVMSDFEESGDDDVLRKVLGDLEAAGLQVDRDALRARMDALLVEAKTQMLDAV